MDLSSDDKKKVELTNDAGALKCSKTNLGTYTCSEVIPTKYISGVCIDDSSSINYLGTIEVNPTNFATDDWATISAAAKSGAYEGKYSVGDTKEVDLGSLGKHTVRIANTSTPDECSKQGFSQAACGFVIEFADIITTHNMNPSGEYKGTTYQYGWNKDGWPASSMRSYLSATIYNALPADIQSIIIDTRVVSGHGSSDRDNFISTDKLYLLDAREVYGISFTNSYNTSNDSERQLDYYLAQGVTTSNYSGAIKQLNGSDSWWWLRAACVFNIFDFSRVSSYGDWYVNNASNAIGVSPAFRIA